MAWNYLKKTILREIGSLIGRIICTDYNTANLDRGKFARMVIELNLSKLIISKIMIDCEIQSIDYKGLPNIYYRCGKVGH